LVTAKLHSRYLKEYESEAGVRVKNFGKVGVAKL